MTIEEMHTLFDIIQDRYNAPYFIEVEKDELLNVAQTTLVNSILFSDKIGRSGDQKLSDNNIINESEIAVILQSIRVLDESKTPAAGKIALSGLSNTFNDLISLRRVSDNLKIRFIRGNLGSYYANYFKKPSTDRLYYDLSNGNINIYPTSEAGAIYVSYYKKPAVMNFGTSTDTDLPEIVHPKIVSYAIELAGIALFDEAMTAVSQVQ